MNNNDFIRRFEDIHIGDRPAVGGKGASLGELLNAGVRVPPGFVVRTSAFRAAFRQSGIGPEIVRTIEALHGMGLEEIAAATREIRARIVHEPLPAPVNDAVVAAYEQLARQDAEFFPVAVRSSATSEDSEEASFAGLQETLLWVLGEAGVLHAVRECWASLYSAESVSYRLRLALPEPEVAMAVVIQRMVNARSAGVMFTRSPATGDRSVIAIEGSWGIGSAIVSGEVTPDKFIVSKVTGEVSGRTIAQKAIEHAPDPKHGGIVTRAVPTEQQRQPCITDEELRELVRLGKNIERHYGHPQDIEWAIDRAGAFPDNIYLLQSRPETVWAKKDRERQPTAVPKAHAYDHVFSLMGGRK
jgi:pyruvate,water dikinase